MSFSDVLKKSFLEGFVASDLTTTQIVVTITITALFGLYIFLIYRLTTQKTFYSKSFNVSLVALAMITAGIILAIQSSVVISLGMVGALSIVRFRTAIKNPMDLVFLFWAISVGIICGAGLFEVALIVSVTVTIAIIGLELMPMLRVPKLLVINAKDTSVEEKLWEVVEKYSKRRNVKSRNLTDGGVDMVIEIAVKEDEVKMLNEIKEIEGIRTVSLVTHEG